MREPHEVVVVGAGPAGAACALSLVQRGIVPLVLDRARFPRSKACAGGLSPGAARVLDALGLWPAVEERAQHVDRARIEALGGGAYTVLDTAHGWVLDRRELDRLAVERMRERGIQVREGSRVRSIDWEDGRAVRIDADGPGGVARLEARWAVAAGGAHMGRRLALARGRTLHALVFRTPDLVHDRRAIELIFDETIYPHYGWVFPEPGGGCNVGICVEDSRRRGRPIGALLEEFLERRLAGRWRGARRRNGLRGHPILASAFPRVATPPGVLPAGEAACLVNPVTGEGIGPALRSGVAAARAVAREVGGAATRERAAAGYRAELARCVAPSLVVGEALRLAGVRSLDWIFANRRWLFGGRRILRLALHL